jgi:hypothetical protein
MSKLFNLNPRKPTALSEEAARKLEAAIEAKGEGVAGQTASVSIAAAHAASPAPAPVAAPQAHELTSSVEAPAERAAAHAPAFDEEPEVDLETAPIVELPTPVRSSVSSRARSVTKPRARELPTTGLGTLHNPRVRKTDGVKTRSTTVHLPVELAKKLAVHCAMTGRKQSDVIAEAVEAILG